MMRIILLILISITNFNSYGQLNSEEKIQDALFSLKEHIRDWSCNRFLEGSFTENLEISLKEGKLIFQSNFSLSDAQYFGYPEYTKAIIDLSMVKTVTIQETEKQCAGININTKVNGIQLINKYRNSNIEVPMPKEFEFREKFGWKNDAIRLSKSSSFEGRSNKVINEIKQIAILSGNTILEEAQNISNTQLSNPSVIKMRSIGGVSVIPCKVNGLNLNFIFDTGASNVTLSMTEASFMFKNGYLDKNDIIGSNNFLDASGNINEGINVNIKEIEIGETKLLNIKATIVKNSKAPLLLGQSALKKLGEINFDLNANTLTILNGKRSTTDYQNDSKIQKENTTSSVVIGKSIKIGGLEIAQTDFPKLFNWNEATKACSQLKNGWRLPTKDELNFLYENKKIIGGFTDFPYWSSYELEPNGALYQIFSNGRQIYFEKDNALSGMYVRCVRSY